MTNAEKFIEVMNKTFNAGLTPENLKTNLDAGTSKGVGLPCSPCGVYKVGACKNYTCVGCQKWWDKEYVEPEEAM